MAYNQSLESVRDRLTSVITSVNGAAPTGYLALPELWDKYLTLTGFTFGSLLDRQAAAAKAAGIPITTYVLSTTPVLGPELANPIGTGSGFTLTGTTPPTHDGTGIHFPGSEGLAAATQTVSSGVLVDNATYRISITTANYVSGTGRVLVYGQTSQHLGSTNSAPSVANGTITIYRALTAAGSNFREIRLQCQTGVCTFDFTNVSVKRVF